MRTRHPFEGCPITVQALPTRSERSERSVRAAAGPLLGSTYGVRSESTKGPCGSPALSGVVFLNAWDTNGLIRQYLPKRSSMANITQRACNRIAHKLNTRPRKRLAFRTPEECYVQN